MNENNLEKNVGIAGCLNDISTLGFSINPYRTNVENKVSS